jgi:hypothetical protein
VQPTGCDFSEGGDGPNKSPHRYDAAEPACSVTTCLRSARAIEAALLLTLIGLAIVLLALGGWLAQALRLPR